MLIFKYIKNIIITLIVIGSFMFSVSAQTDFSEAEVKSGFVYNFAKFVDWPAGVFHNETTPFAIGVIGDDVMYQALEKVMNGRQIKGRETVVLKVENLKEVPKVEILLVGVEQKGNSRAIISQLKTKPILLIGNDIEEFCQLGGMINFSSRVSKYGFEINQAGVERSNLIISAKLLSLAQLVKEYDSNK